MSVSHPNDAYLHLHRSFGWEVPAQFNMAEACCGRWARSPQHAAQTAVIEHVAGQAQGRRWTFKQLQEAANALSLQLVELGVRAGERVAIVLPQRFETAVAYMAVLQMGAVAMPLSMLFGAEALAFRLQDSQAKVALCDEVSEPVLRPLQTACPSLQAVFNVTTDLKKGPHK